MTRETTDEILIDWLSRQVRSGRLLELPSYAPVIGGPLYRPERFARRLLDNLNGSGDRSPLQAAIDAELFRDWARAQTPTRRRLAAPRIMDPMTDVPSPAVNPRSVPENVETVAIGRALRTIAHPTGDAPDWPIVPPPRPRMKHWWPVTPRILPLVPLALVPYGLVLFGWLIGVKPFEEHAWALFAAGYLMILSAVSLFALGRASAEQRWRRMAASRPSRRAYSLMPWLLLICLTLATALVIAAARAGREVRITSEQARTWALDGLILIILSGSLIAGEWHARRSRKPAGSGIPRHPLD